MVRAANSHLGDRSSCSTSMRMPDSSSAGDARLRHVDPEWIEPPSRRWGGIHYPVEVDDGKRRHAGP